MNRKPKFFKIFKIIGCVSATVVVTGIVFVIIGAGDFETNYFLFGMMMIIFGLFFTILGFVNGFMPEISRGVMRGSRYLQQENKDILKDISSTAADISSDAFTTTAQAIKKGLQDTMYCKHCGGEIDKDSKFCKHCGKII